MALLLTAARALIFPGIRFGGVGGRERRWLRRPSSSGPVMPTPPAEMRPERATWCLVMAGGFGASLELSALNGSNGFVINGIDADD